MGWGVGRSHTRLVHHPQGGMGMGGCLTWLVSHTQGGGMGALRGMDG